MPILRTLALVLGLIALPSTGLAHRLDEYLQATLVSIEPGDILLQINLTPGVAVAEQVLGRIDRNHDGVISTSEAAAYNELMKSQIVLALDGRKIALNLASSNFPTPTELRTGWGFIQIEFTANFAPLAPGTHKVTLENRHLPTFSVYLFNAAQPKSSLVQITKQRRNKEQSTGEIEFVIDRKPQINTDGHR